MIRGSVRPMNAIASVRPAYLGWTSVRVVHPYRAAVVFCAAAGNQRWAWTLALRRAVGASPISPLSATFLAHGLEYFAGCAP